MKAILLVAGSGPLLILTSYASTTDPKLVEGLRQKGIEKFIAFALPLGIGVAMIGCHRPTSGCHALRCRPNMESGTRPALSAMPFISGSCRNSTGLAHGCTDTSWPLGLDK